MAVFGVASISAHAALYSLAMLGLPALWEQKETAPLGGRSLLRLVEVARIELASGSTRQSGLHA